VISCGGTRVGTRHVVTAAHCLKAKSWAAKPRDVTVYTDSVEKWKGIVARVARIHTHPQFSTDDGTHDIAVLRLKKALSDKAAAVLSKTEVKKLIGKLAAVSGWGATVYQGGYNTLQILEVPVVEKCARYDFKNV
jgi:trypsin